MIANCIAFEKSWNMRPGMDFHVYEGRPPFDGWKYVWMCHLTELTTRPKLVTNNVRIHPASEKKQSKGMCLDQRKR